MMSASISVILSGIPPHRLLGLRDAIRLGLLILYTSRPIHSAKQLTAFKIPRLRKKLNIFTVQIM